MAPPIYDFSGIVSTADRSTATYLPLESLDVYISLVDVSARVVLSQLYSHHGPNTLSEAFYVFPVPARAAVCSFEMKANNGVRLKGVVKELSLAKEDYQQALSKGLLAGLLEQFHQDVFVMSIGSMPPNTEVTVLLSYVVDISEDEEIDSVRFQLPSHVRARYGASSDSALYHETSHSAPLTITVDISMPGEIVEATSLNHNPFIDLQLPSTPSYGAHRSRHFARKRFFSENCNLQPDFLLIVRAYGLGRPRCFAEKLSHKENSVVVPTTALALTIVPQFDLNIQPMQEYIFMVDRSGSMSGSGIHVATQTLQLLLEQLSVNSVFNIYSFGSRYCSMWPGSCLRTAATVREATMQVNAMQADMGGTELLGALMGIFGSRRTDIPTCVLVLTDGGIMDIDSAVQAVYVAVSKASATAPLRVFTLGMGSGASTELCERLALAGNGSCLMTVEGEPLAFKASRLVKATETPQVKNMSIDWGHDVVHQVRQAPHQIGALSPGMRLLVTALIPGEQVPTEVSLRMDLVDGSTFNYRVPVELVSDYIPENLTKALEGTTDIPPLIHTLTAHLLIQDLEGGRTQPLELQWMVAPSPETRRNVIKRSIVELGTRYQIASSRTAFVAVEAPAPPKFQQQGNRNRRSSRSKVSHHSSSRGDSSTHKSKSHDSESRSGHTKGMHGNQSDTNGKSNTKNSTPGRTAPSTPSKSSKASSPRGDTKNQVAGTGVKSGDEGPKTQQSSPASQQTSTRSGTSPSHASQGQKGSASGSPSKSETTESQSPTNRMPGAFKQSSNAGATPPGGLFDFFTHKPSPDSVLVEEVLYVPDPQGGNPTIFTAPPPPHYTTITTMVKSLFSFIFSRNPLGGSKRNSQKQPAGMRKALFPEAILTMTRLQSSDGSFLLKRELSSVVGIPVLQLQEAAPTMEYGESNESVWATAIAIAFFEKRQFQHIALWEEIGDKGIKFGSRVCGSDGRFRQIVQEAHKLFLP